MSDPTILLVDDEPVNLEILVEHMESMGFNSVTAENGKQAWDILNNNKDLFDAVLLDRMMPEMDGMEVLKLIRADSSFNNLPVIMQTAMARKEDIFDGINAGAYYYLTKPFDHNLLVAIVQTAVKDSQNYRLLKQELARNSKVMAHFDQGKFSFQKLEDGKDIAVLLANALPEAERIVLGLSELLINAVEHGNLGITYEDKSKLIKNNAWVDEVKRRLALDEYKGKKVVIEFEKTDDKVSFLIKDEGNGFDWTKYMDFCPDRAFDSHGRGIAMANMTSFDHIEYRGNGNTVLAVIHLNKPN